MKVKILLLLMGSIIFLQNCAPTKVTKMAAVTSSDQKVDYDGTIISQKKHFVSLSPYTELDVAEDKTMFMLGVENYGEDPINIGYGNISVIFEGNTESRIFKRIKVQHYDDFMNDLKEEYSIKEKRFIRKALEDIQIDIEAAEARSSSSSSSDSSSSSGFDSSSSSGSSGSSSSSFNSILDSLTNTLSDSDLQSVENDLEDLKMDIEIMRSNNQRLQAALQEILLQPSTVMPGNNFTGIVVCDTRDMNSETEGNFQITVSLDREEHNFTFKRSLYNK